MRSLEQTSMADKVTREIRRSILSGELKPGQRFSLREIAGQLDVSFIPVRESLRQLEAQGLVVTSHGKSAVVAPLDLEELHSIYRLRRRLEPELAGRACPLLGPKDFSRLETLLATFADGRLDADEIYEAHHTFHLELLRPATTAWDLRILESLWHAAERYIRLAFDSPAGDRTQHDQRVEIHSELLEVFRSGDPEAAATAVLHHLDSNERVALQAIPPGTS
ncbi:GntR family transcriptional regulator [Streptomyces sp. GbtcB7]|uniref:GntR family transcriptional regulator n=1 Tax=Streptomyces sp. GbtcB7 TaxID=2824752 RepID=UPI0027E5BC4D|nr:GntR family transcriptional regulator [Streptomyces sp. GbtcB7]